MSGQTPPRVGTSVLIRPKRDLWLSAWVACIMFTVPVFLSLYLITIPTGRWLPFAVAHLVLLILFAVAVARLRGAGIRLSDDGIREREYFSRMVFTSADTVASVIVIRLRDSNSDEISNQLFIVDAAGRTLLRLRGQLWHPHDLNQVMNFYAVPVLRVDAPMTWPQLRRSYGRNLDRWERHPVLTIGALALAFILVMVPVLIGALTEIQ